MTTPSIPEHLQSPVLVTPNITGNQDTRLAEVDGDELAEYLDGFELGFNDDHEGYTAGVLQEDALESVFPDKEKLSKLKSFPDLVNSLPEQPKKANELIAEALQAMSMEQREQIIRELYGVEKVSPSVDTTSHVLTRPVTPNEGDDPLFHETKLEEMDRQLEKLKRANGWNLKLAALELAESQNLEYTQSRSFRLKFLKSDRFDAGRAASRFIRYFDWKLKLFGEESLTRDITYHDLTKEDQAMLKKGHLQRLPVRDRAGRAIYCCIYNGQQYESPESMVRQNTEY